MTLPVSRDLDLPQWGPYNKKYDGFSHIAHPEQGLRFDVDVFPGFYRRGIMNTKPSPTPAHGSGMPGRI